MTRELVASQIGLRNPTLVVDDSESLIEVLSTYVESRGFVEAEFVTRLEAAATLVKERTFGRHPTGGNCQSARRQQLEFHTNGTHARNRSNHPLAKSEEVQFERRT